MTITQAVLWFGAAVLVFNGVWSFVCRSTGFNYASLFWVSWQRGRAAE